MNSSESDIRSTTAIILNTIIKRTNQKDKERFRRVPTCFNRVEVRLRNKEEDDNLLRYVRSVYFGIDSANSGRFWIRRMLPGHYSCMFGRVHTLSSTETMVVSVPIAVQLRLNRSRVEPIISSLKEPKIRACATSRSTPFVILTDDEHLLLRHSCNVTV